MVLYVTNENGTRDLNSVLLDSRLHPKKMIFPNCDPSVKNSSVLVCTNSIAKGTEIVNNKTIIVKGNMELESGARVHLQNTNLNITKTLRVPFSASLVLNQTLLFTRNAHIDGLLSFQSNVSLGVSECIRFGKKSTVALGDNLAEKILADKNSSPVISGNCVGEFSRPALITAAKIDGKCANVDSSNSNEISFSISSCNYETFPIWYGIVAAVAVILLAVLIGVVIVSVPPLKRKFFPYSRVNTKETV